MQRENNMYGKNPKLMEKKAHSMMRLMKLKLGKCGKNKVKKSMMPQKPLWENQRKKNDLFLFYFYFHIKNKKSSFILLKKCFFLFF